MRISDEQRRERAKNLRDQAEAWRSLMPDIRMSDRRLVDSIHMAFGLDDVDITVHEALDMLADLIDIPTCVMTNVGGDFENSFQCSNCMNEFDMPDYDRYPYKRCPECGAVVLDGAQN